MESPISIFGSLMLYTETESIKFKNLTDKIITVVRNVLVVRGQCNIMLTGGNSARMLYNFFRETNRINLCCTSLNLFLTDERYSPSILSDTNHYQIMHSLFGNSLPKNIFFPKFNFKVPIQHALDEYINVLPNRIDVLIITLADDGHIASLFPNDPILLNTTDKYVITSSPYHPYKRFTVAPSMIKNADVTFALAFGNSKHRAYYNSIDSKASLIECPSKLLNQPIWCR